MIPIWREARLRLEATQQWDEKLSQLQKSVGQFKKELDEFNSLKLQPAAPVPSSERVRTAFKNYQTTEETVRQAVEANKWKAYLPHWEADLTKLTEPLESPQRDVATNVDSFLSSIDKSFQTLQQKATTPPSPTKPEPMPSSDVTDQKLKQLAKDVATQKKLLDELQQRLANTPSAGTDNSRIDAQIAELRKEVKRIQSSLANGASGAISAPESVASPKSTLTADQLFRRALYAARHDDWKAAVEDATKAAELAPTIKNLYAKAVMEASAGQDSEARATVIAIVNLLKGNRSVNSDVHSYFELLQGRGRRFVESELARLLAP